jgi:prepilin-type N-terminal cleavage/methylation domain-containing protein/prepilin-type processing-associated H-X9-DG protein
MRRRAFSLIELLVVIGIIAVLIGIALPVMEKVRHRGYINACASNLRQIGQAMQMYAGENRGALPRTIYDPAQASAPLFGNYGAQADPFGGPIAVPNDVTTAVHLLMRAQKLPSGIFICPYNDATTYEADRADAATRSNFTDWRKNLGYSIANPYPTHAAIKAGYQWTAKLPAGFALVADLSCGTTGPHGESVLDPLPNSPMSIQRRANSENHEKEGQNVLFADGHVTYELTVFCGVNGDNIYCSSDRLAIASPVNRNDSVLLPTDD